jgi:hypothetical protein
MLLCDNDIDVEVICLKTTTTNKQIKLIEETNKNKQQ